MDTADDATDAGTEVRVMDRDVVNEETCSFIGGLGGHNLWRTTSLPRTELLRPTT